MADIILNEEGQVEITTKISAQEYINNKLMTIRMLQEQIDAAQQQINKEVAEITTLINEQNNI